jgi:hypothetical protein
MKQKFGSEEKGCDAVYILWQNGQAKRWGTMSASPHQQGGGKATRLQKES